MLDVTTFQSLCVLVSEEQDESKLELLKERMKVLLADRDQTKQSSPEAFVN
jgi:hypothetical protein